MDQIDILDKDCEMNGLDVVKRDLKIYLDNQLAGILKEEELKWFQRSKGRDLLEGDCNTKCYHAKANGRKRNNTIFSLHQDESVIKGSEKLLHYITVFIRIFLVIQTPL